MILNYKYMKNLTMFIIMIPAMLFVILLDWLFIETKEEKIIREYGS